MASEPNGDPAELRRRLELIEAFLASLGEGDLTGASAMVCKTTSLGSYPTGSGAGKMFALQQLDVAGVETEGGSATTNALSGTFFGMMLGTGLPPANTQVLVVMVPYCPVFAYYG